MKKRQVDCAAVLFLKQAYADDFGQNFKIGVVFLSKNFYQGSQNFLAVLELLLFHLFQHRHEQLVNKSLEDQIFIAGGSNLFDCFRNTEHIDVRLIETTQNKLYSFLWLFNKTGDNQLFLVKFTVVVVWV